MAKFNMKPGETPILRLPSLWGLWQAVTLALVLALSGCGTLANTFEAEPKNKVYVGVRQDFTGWTFAHGGFIDWPFSLVLDTILLPYTIPVTIWNHARAGETEPAPGGEGANENEPG